MDAATYSGMTQYDLSIGESEYVRTMFDMVVVRLPCVSGTALGRPYRVRRVFTIHRFAGRYRVNEGATTSGERTVVPLVCSSSATSSGIG